MGEGKSEGRVEYVVQSQRRKGEQRGGVLKMILTCTCIWSRKGYSLQKGRRRRSKVSTKSLHMILIIMLPTSSCSPLPLHQSSRLSSWHSPARRRQEREGLTLYLVSGGRTEA